MTLGQKKMLRFGTVRLEWKTGFRKGHVRIVSYRIVSYRIVSYRIVSYRIVSYRIVSYRIVSYRIVSDRVGSGRVVSRIVSKVEYCPISNIVFR